MLHTAFPASTWDAAEAPALQNKLFFIWLWCLQLQHCLAQLLLCPMEAEQEGRGGTGPRPHQTR